MSRTKIGLLKKTEKMKAYTLDQVQDKLIGKIGTPGPKALNL